MTRLQISHEESARYFLRSHLWASLMETDINVQPAATARIALLLLAPWQDAGRATRAINLLDQELRRAATASSLWREAGQESDPDLLTEVRDLQDEAGGELWPIREYRDHLESFPSPTGTRGGLLRITAAHADPFAVLLEPEKALFDLLGAQPASSLAYAMSAFGQNMHVRHHWHARLCAARYASPQETLRVLTAVLNGEWPGAARGESRIDDNVPGRPVLYRAISPPARTGSGRRPAAVLYVAGRDGEDTLTAIGLHEQATSLLGYRHLLLTDQGAR